MVTPGYVEQLYVALHDQPAVDFLMRSLKASYLEYYGEYQSEINAMIEEAIALLVSSQAARPNEAQLHATIEEIKRRIFRKGDESFWFNFAFGFKPPKVWRSLFQQRGFVLTRSFMFGFEAGKMHKDCQVWMVFDREDGE